MIANRLWDYDSTAGNKTNICFKAHATDSEDEYIVIKGEFIVVIYLGKSIILFCDTCPIKMCLLHS